MKSVSKKVSKTQVSVLIPTAMYEKAVEAAQSGGNSLASWLRYAIASSVKRWEAPAGAVNSEGIEHFGAICTACNDVAVAQCKKPKKHKDFGKWLDEKGFYVGGSATLD